MHYLGVGILLTALPLAAFCAPAGDPSNPGKIHLLGGPTGSSGPCDIDTGPDGQSIWFQDLDAGTVGSYNVLTKKFTLLNIDWSIPPSQQRAPHYGTATTLQCWLRTGSDGNIYAGSGSRSDYAKIDPETLKVTIRGVPGVKSPNGLDNAATGENGLFLASTAGNTILYLEYATQSTKVYHLPAPKGGPLGVAVDSQQILWYTDFYSSQIGRLDTMTGAIEVYNAPPGGEAPAVMRAYTEEKYLWANSMANKTLVRINTLTSALEVIGTPNDGLEPDVNTNDSNGNVWYSSSTADLLLSFEPSNKELTTIHLPGEQSDPSGNETLPIHYGPLNAIWFTDLATGQLGYLSLG